MDYVAKSFQRILLICPFCRNGVDGRIVHNDFQVNETGDVIDRSYEFKVSCSECRVKYTIDVKVSNLMAIGGKLVDVY